MREFPRLSATRPLEDPALTTPPHTLPSPSKDLGSHNTVSALSRYSELNGSPFIAEKMIAPRLLLFVKSRLDERSVLYCQMLHNCYTVVTLSVSSRAGIK